MPGFGAMGPEEHLAAGTGQPPSPGEEDPPVPQAQLLPLPSLFVRLAFIFCTQVFTALACA